MVFFKTWVGHGKIPTFFFFFFFLFFFFFIMANPGIKKPCSSGGVLDVLFEHPLPPYHYQYVYLIISSAKMIGGVQF